ncbi:hypothetical protein [Tetrasphaera phage TJE1]|uniref:Uncharacterized protein n=1 Tax=Tetrasphaera phage TJE1 TaxID=981335 RepID=G4W987_9CAUD|nr:hypothetical protein G185_gp55 [Tetrasphaera phage TJE1]ADX42575.1 hypothetical protein [Tetrasphaera phage TJE1]
MSAATDTALMYEELRREQQEKGQVRKEANLRVLRGTTIPFEFRNGGDVVILRNKHYPAVDFYPTKNKWTVGTRTVLGDAHEFVLWLKRRAL